MALALGSMIQHQATQLSDLKEFLVPKILSVNLKKKAEDRSMGFETGFGTIKNGGDVNKSIKLTENEQKNLIDISKNDEHTGELDIVHQTEDEEDVMEMAPQTHRSKNSKKSSYLLKPFLKPVAKHLKGTAGENPILKALFGGGNASNSKSLYHWVNSGERTATSNCHPFKKTKLSRDIVNNSTPVQIPKSLTKKRSESKPRSGSTPPPGREKNAVAVVTSKKTQSPNRPKSSSEKENKPFASEEELKRTWSKSVSARSRISSLSSLRKVGYVNSEKLMKLRTFVDNAIKNHRVYSMTGCYTSVRNALKQRGWIEKIDSDIKGKRKNNKFEEIGIYDAAFQFVQKYPTLAAMRYSTQTHSGFSHNDQINYSGQGEAEIINRMLRNINEDLCWLSRPYPYYCWKDISKFDLVNRLPKAYFSNKIGLCNSLQHIQWFFEPGVCSTQYPRTYNMSQKDEYEAFKDDFRMTACIGLLKWLINNYGSGGERAVRSVDGKVDASVLDFALKRCTEYMKYREHEDIDLPDGATVWEYQWDNFITQYYKIINDGQLLKECKSDPSIQVYVKNALSLLSLIKKYWPQINIDGYQNFWVVKPGGRCCGNGIVIKNNLEQILTLVNPTVTRETRYVVQKYIERPLLIYNTKFDIRQWFLVTSVYPLTVWMYRESYLRFCSQPFSLRNTHESIHLCNNAVQRRYKNSKRDRSLPEENMWDCYTFKTYLKSIGHPDAWDKYIYPGMKEGFVGALLASQDTMERRKNCFELYGADFMISDTLTDGPWLIEINSNPAMDSSTSVTARMCPQVLEDIVKVVIDRRDDKNASTGAFELVFKQHCPPVPPYLGMSLSIKGQKVIRTNPGDPKLGSKKSKSPNSCGKFLQSETDDSQSEGVNDYSEAGMNKDTVPQSLLPEILNGLKKEILQAKLSISLIHGDREASKRTSEILNFLPVEDSLPKVVGQKLDSPKIENKLEDIENKLEDIEIIYGDDEIEIIGPENHAIFGNEIKKDESQTIVGTDSNMVESLFEETLNDLSKEILEKSLITECPVPAQKMEIIQEVHPFSYVEEETREEEVINETEEEEEISIQKTEFIQEVHPISCAEEETREEEVMNETEEEEEISIQKTELIQEVHPISCAEEETLEEEVMNETGKEGKEKEDLAQKDEVVKTAHHDVFDEEEIIEKEEALEVEEKEEESTSQKYIVKQEAKKIVTRKTSWKANTKNRTDYCKSWKICKKKKIDYVQKNIQNIRVMQEKKRVSYKSCKLKNITQTYRKIAPISKSILASDRIHYERLYEEELLKMLHYTDRKCFIQECCAKKESYWNKYLRNRSESEGRILSLDPDKSGVDIFKRDGKSWKPECSIKDEEDGGNKFEIPPICSEIASRLAVKKEITPMDRSSCPNFGEREFFIRESYARGKSETLLTDWKANVETVKRTCHDILMKLREFNESNSKVRLQEALREGQDIEEALKVYRKAGKRHFEVVKTGKKYESENLAINRENGAVRRVDRTIPKIRQY